MNQPASPAGQQPKKEQEVNLRILLQEMIQNGETQYDRLKSRNQHAAT